MVTVDRPDAGASVDTHVDRERAPYEHALADAEFRARVGAGYAGTHDLLDALWWLEHPLDPAPSGATPPASLLDIARRVLYAPSATADAVRRYREAMGREQLDRESLEAAVTAIGHLEDDDAPHPILGRSADASPPPQADVATSNPVAAAPGWGAERRRRWAAVGIAAALSLVALLGWARPAAGSAEARMQAARSSHAAARMVLVEVQTRDESALPPFPAVAPKRARVLARRLAVVASTTVTASVTHGLVCLEVRTGSRASSTCRSHHGFWSTGIQVPFPTSSPSIEKVVWLPDGRLRLWTVR